jgi:hypothetical protein
LIGISGKKFLNVAALREIDATKRNVFNKTVFSEIMPFEIVAIRYCMQQGQVNVKYCWVKKVAGQRRIKKQRGCAILPFHSITQVPTSAKTFKEAVLKVKHQWVNVIQYVRCKI